MSKRVNSYDVARVAGVSRAVVSLVINGKADKYRISRATQARVRAAVLQTGYAPNHFIRNMYLQMGAVTGPGTAGVGSDPARVTAVINQALASAGYQMKVSSLSADQAAGLLLLLGPTTSPNPSPLPSSVAPICDRSPSSPAPVITQPKPVIPPTPAPVIIPIPIPAAPPPLSSSVAPICDRSPDSPSAGEGGDSSPPSSPEPVIAEPAPEPIPSSDPEPSAPPPSEREGGDSSPPSSLEPVIAEPPAAAATIPAPEPAPPPAPEPVIVIVPAPIDPPPAEPITPVISPLAEPLPPALEPIPATPIILQREGGDSSPPSSPEPVIAEPPPEPLPPSSLESSTTTLP